MNSLPEYRKRRRLLSGGEIGFPGRVYYLAPEDESRDARIMRLRDDGKSVRTIAYLLGVPRATVGDVIKRRQDSLPEPSPFYQLVEF